jgi:hypothetical protein
MVSTNWVRIFDDALYPQGFRKSQQLGRNMQTKITLIIDNPAAPDEFEREMPAIFDRAGALPGLVRLESAKVWPKEDGTATPAYRTLDLYFEDYAAASDAVNTAEAAAFFEALSRAGGSGFTGLFSEVESRPSEH